MSDTIRREDFDRRLQDYLDEGDIFDYYEGKVIDATAWDCVGQFAELVDETHFIRLPKGKIEWSAASYNNGNTVRFSRFDTSGGDLVIRFMYLKPEHPIQLIPIEGGKYDPTGVKNSSR